MRRERDVPVTAPHTAPHTAQTRVIERRDIERAVPAPVPPAARRPVPDRSPRPARSARPRGPWARVAVGGAVVLGASLLGGAVAQAQGVTSGAFVLAKGQFRSADSGLGLLDGTGAATFEVPARPTGGGLYLGVDVRATGGTKAYRGKARVLADGTMRVGLSKLVGGTEVAIGSVPVTSRITGSGQVHVEVSVRGTSVPEVSARAWVVGAATPGWQYVVSDRTSGQVTGSGSVRAWAYLSGSATGPMTVSFSGLSARPTRPDTPAPISSGTTPSTTPPTTASGSPSGSPSGAPTTTAGSATSITSPPATSASSSGGSGGGGGTTEPQPSTSAPAPPATGYPSAGNTGVPAGTKLTVHNGDLTITKAGTVISGLDVHGFVEVKAANVTIKNSIIRGGKTSTSKGLVQNTTTSASNLVLQDSELRPSNPSLWLVGVKGGNFTVNRVHINGGVVDGVMVHGNNVVVTDTYIHGLVYYANDPNHSDGSHNDGVQVLGGSSISIRHNTILVAKGENAVLQVTQGVSSVKGLSFNNNFADGATCSVKLTEKGASSLGPVTVNSNRFGRAQSISGCAILRTNATSLTASGNVWDDNGKSVAVKVYG